ncbi:MAG: ParB/RepB/Spo0J family partition protein [Bacteroidales bacterium]|jgi:ParB family chromosome partitioning protein|nr:ParB/RepB/Spo0J family partition protein [Bacteroidales bacterium]MCI1786336.1 ParB/RepB/Spo0J family partition protein [Bacteroidales bacterium]
MSKPVRGLGKGLGALLGENADLSQLRKPVGYVNKEIAGKQEASDTADVLRIPIDMIEPNPYQPRMSFDQDALEELAESIKALGLIQPVTVRKLSEDRYQIISGERRFRACRLAGFDMIPAYIRDANDQGMLEMAIVENIQRENLDPIEIALSYQRLIEECHLTQEQMADRVGKKRASVTNYLRLLKLPAKIQHDLKVGLLSVGHAKVLLGIDNPFEQERLCDIVIKDGLSVRQLENRIKKNGAGVTGKGKENGQNLPDEYYKVLERFGKYFDDNISLKRSSSGKGSITIRFSSDSEIQKFLRALEDSNL